MRLENKYRPKKWEDYVGQEHIIPRLETAVEKDFYDMDNMMFIGGPGVGKTVAAEIMARQLKKKTKNFVFKRFNASDDRGINVVRESIERLARTQSPKILFLDECDQMTSEAQHALRVIMEAHPYRHTRFILSCNYENRIIDPIQSRCAIFRFRGHEEEDIASHLLWILDSEGITYQWNEPDPENLDDFEPTEFQQALFMIIEERNGDLRGAINDVSNLVTNDKEINVANVLELIPVKIGVDILKKAYNGNYREAQALLEDFLVQKKHKYEWLFKEWRSEILNLNPPEVARKISIALAKYEANCRAGNIPMIQLEAFLSYVEIAKHLPALKSNEM